MRRLIRVWPRPRAFISYSRHDQPIALRIYESLSAAGFETFLDTEGTLTGERFDRVITRQLRRADVVVAVISRTAAASAWCLAELSYAHALRRPVAPVQIGSEEVTLPQPLDWLQRSIHRLTVTELERDAWVATRLARDLATARRRRTGRTLLALAAAGSLTALVIAGWFTTVRTLNASSRERGRVAVVNAIENSDRTLQRATVESLVEGFKDDAELLQRLRSVVANPDRPNVQRLNAFVIENALATARDPRNRWYLADLSWNDAVLEGASLAGVTFQTGTIANVRFRRTNFAGVVWNRSPLNGEPGLMLSNVSFEASRFEGGEFAGTGGVRVQFVNSHFTGTRIAVEHLAATVFKSERRDPDSPVITDEITVMDRVVLEHCAPRAAPNVLEIVPEGSEIVFDGVMFEGVQFRGWFRPEWFRNSHFIDCILPPELIRALEERGNTVSTPIPRSTDC